MKSALTIACACLVLLVSSGCIPIPIPYRGVTRPGASGIVLDARTGQPIVGAAVTMHATNSYLRSEFDSWPFIARVDTTGEGNYCIPPDRGWRGWLIPWFGVNSVVQCRLLVTHPSYESDERYFWVTDDLNAFWVMPATANLSPVYLNPLPK